MLRISPTGDFRRPVLHSPTAAKRKRIKGGVAASSDLSSLGNEGTGVGFKFSVQIVL